MPSANRSCGQKNEAEAEYSAKLQELADTLRDQKKILNLTRSVLVSSAKSTRDQELAGAANVKQTSDSKCADSHKTRTALVTKDEETIHDEIKPLLEQLKTCSLPSASGASGGAPGANGGNLLELSADKSTVSSRTRGAHKSKCSSARRKLKAKMLLLETSTKSAVTAAAETPGQEVTGNMGDWEKRLQDEKTNADNVRKSCEDEASAALASVTSGLNTVFENAKSHADSEYSDGVAKIEGEIAKKRSEALSKVEATRLPAAEAVAAYEQAKQFSEEKDAARDASVNDQESRLTAAREEHALAASAARQAQQDTVNSLKASAESLRTLSRKDAGLKEKNKKAECSSESDALLAELGLIGQIKQKIATLTTIKDDVLGEKAEAEAADFKQSLKCSTHCLNGACKKNQTAGVGSPPVSSMPSGSGPVFDMDDLCGDWYANTPPGYAAAPGIRWKNSATQADPVGDAEGLGSLGTRGYWHLSTPSACALKCSSTPNCKGFNFWGKKNEHQCHLGSRQMDRDYKTSTGYYYCAFAEVAPNDEEYTCDCEDGWSGEHCEKSTNKCEENPDLCNDGTCAQTGPGTYSCTCSPGYDGVHCDNDIDDCAAGMCGDHGHCVDGIAEHTCKCEAGYEGANCEVEIRTCAHNPCANGGTCTDGAVTSGATFQCTCTPQYTGTHCTTDVNECTKGICQHGSTCNNVVGGHTCTCSQWYSGTNCQDYVNQCKQCHASRTARCTNRWKAGSNPVKAPLCHCKSGYEGSRCATKKPTIVERVVNFFSGFRL
jgi:hypothetical protein